MGFAKLAESPFVKGTDITQPLLVTIQRTKESSFKEPDGSARTAAVLGFYEIDKELVLNKTNLITLLEVLGNDERLWINKQIVIRSIPAIDNRTGLATRRLFVELPQAPAQPQPAAPRPVPPPQSQAPQQEDVPHTWQPIDEQQPIPDPADYALPRTARGTGPVGEKDKGTF